MRVNLKSGFLSAAAIGMGLGFGSLAAFAQTAIPSEGVMDRPRPDFDAKGLPLGGFRLFPKLNVEVGNDDNVLRQATGAKSSLTTLEAPSFFLGSQWGRHELDLFGNAAVQQYNDLSGEDSADWTVGGSGRLDIERGTDFSATVSHGSLHEPRNSPDLPSFASEPTKYTLSHAQGALSYSPYNFGLRLGAIVDHFNYSATPVLGGGAPISNTDRNRDEYDFYARASYIFSPGYAIFAQADYVAQDFDQTLDRALFHRSNSGYRAEAGLSMQVSHLVQGELFAGYLTQNYKGTLKDVSGVNFGAAVNWFASEVLTVHLQASRTLAATTIAGASTNDNQVFGISADYEVLPNILLQGGFSHTDSVFQGVTRRDQIENERVGVTYLMNRYLSANVTFTHETRSSNSVGGAYDDNIIMGGLTLHP